MPTFFKCKDNAFYGVFLYNYVVIMSLLCNYALFVCGIGFRGKNTKDERTENEGRTKVERRNEKFFPLPTMERGKKPYII